MQEKRFTAQFRSTVTDYCCCPTDCSEVSTRTYAINISPV